MAGKGISIVDGKLDQAVPKTPSTKDGIEVFICDR